jgi:hypothetical protein
MLDEFEWIRRRPLAGRLLAAHGARPGATVETLRV